jgi:hypothetical protein
MGLQNSPARFKQVYSDKAVSQFSKIRALGTMEKLGRIYNVAYCFIYGSLLHWQAEAATF